MDAQFELEFVNTFAALPPAFYTRLQPSGLEDPYPVAASAAAGALLGLSPEVLQAPEMTEILAGNRPWPGADPLAAVYSGHQFGVWAGQLGDGRALLLGEARGPDGQGWELQLKGAGKTPYSRMGDGRAVLRSSIREFLCSEAMFHLGIPTTRALAVVGSDQPVFRESVETAAVLARMAPSFVRFGSFEHFYSHRDEASLRILADHVIERFYPGLREAPQPYAALLREVSARTGRLIARWQAVGFCHGVMNTDNMSILGLTIDYGPFGFLDAFQVNHICNHSDDQGRYAYGMQPRIGEWNCFALGQALLPLIGEVEVAQEALQAYRSEFAAELSMRLHAKLGLRTVQPSDDALFDRLFEIMDAGRVDFTYFFRNLSRLRAAQPAGSGDPGAGQTVCRDLFLDRAAFDVWADTYRARLRQEGSDDAQRAVSMNLENPKYVLRNHLAELAIRKARGTDEGVRLTGRLQAQRVAPSRAALATASGVDAVEEAGVRSDQDFSEIARLLKILSRPFDEQPEHVAYAALPPDWAGGLEVSCSS